MNFANQATYANWIDNPSERKILSFDIGIRNLAWCFMRRNMDNSGNLFIVQGWENVDLLADPTTTTPGKVQCSKCSVKASHQGGVCARHCPADKPAFRDLSGVLVKKLPTQADLKTFCIQKGIVPIPKSRAATLELLAQRYSLPIEVKKQKKAVDTELSVLHDAIRAMVKKNAELFRRADAIHLENQPVLKNPTMKTVQILLYATLRDLLQPQPPQVRLVHAGVKVKGKTSGDKGYKERKQGSETKVEDLFRQQKIKDTATWSAFLAKHAKRNDLTDAFCMCVDALSTE